MMMSHFKDFVTGMCALVLLDQQFGLLDKSTYNFILNTSELRALFLFGSSMAANGGNFIVSVLAVVVYTMFFDVAEEGEDDNERRKLDVTKALNKLWCNDKGCWSNE